MHKELSTENFEINNPETSSHTQSDESNHLVAVDLGSNSFHIIIAREQDGCLQIMYRQKTQVKLAAGLDEDDYLTEQAIDNAVNCLREFNLSLNQLPSNAIRIVATYALRKAKNAEKFINYARTALPYPIEVISGEQEAELIFNGVAHTQAINEATLIIDIGGGSTEFVIGKYFSTSIARSLDMGCISFHQRFFKNGDIDKQSMAAAQSFASKKIAAITDEYQQQQWQVTLGTSGSIKTISRVMLELYGDEKISVKRLNRLVKQLISWKHFDNIPLRSIEPNRRPLLAGAVAILSSCFKHLSINQMSYSAGGVREGVLYQLSESRTDIDPRERTIHNLINLHHIDQAFSHRVQWQLNDFQYKLSSSHAKLSAEENQLLHWAAQLHEIGIAINSKKRQQHGAYIIEHSNMPGFNDIEQHSLALLVANHRGKIKLPDETSPLFLLPEKDKRRLLLLIQILRLALLLTTGRLQQRITPNNLDYQEDTLILTLSKQDELVTSLEEEIQKQAIAKLKLIIKTL